MSTLFLKKFLSKLTLINELKKSKIYSLRDVGSNQISAGFARDGHTHFLLYQEMRLTIVIQEIIKRSML